MKAGRTTSHEIVAAVPDPHRDLRGQAARRDHGEPQRAGRRRRARSRARAGPDPRTAARHSDRAQGQHPHDDMPTTGGALAFVGHGAALRGDADEEPARRRGGDHRQDRHDRAGQLRRRRHADQLQRRARLRLQPLRSAPRSADHRRRAPGAADRRIELRHRHRGELLGRQRRQRNVRLDPEPVEPEHAGGDQADGRPHQPLRRHPDHRRSGHRRADGEIRHGRGDHVRRAGERRARSRTIRRPRRARRRPGTTTRSCCSAGRPEGRAHRHSARQLLRSGHAAGLGSAARRLESRAEESDGGGDRRAQGRRARSSSTSTSRASSPPIRRTTCCCRRSRAS